MELTIALISAAAGLVGVLVGGWISSRSERHRIVLEFVSQQLREFYGPLLSLRSEVQALGDMRNRISQASSEEWQKICAQAPSGFDGAEYLKERYTKFGKIIDYDNSSLRETLMPIYRQMVAIFREKSWLAESETRAFLPSLIEFVDIWERFLAEALPGEVIQAIGHSEANLFPFYEHIEKVVGRLQLKLSGY